MQPLQKVGDFPARSTAFIVTCIAVHLLQKRTARLLCNHAIGAGAVSSCTCLLRHIQTGKRCMPPVTTEYQAQVLYTRPGAYGRQQAPAGHCTALRRALPAVGVFQESSLNTPTTATCPITPHARAQVAHTQQPGLTGCSIA